MYHKPQQSNAADICVDVHEVSRGQHLFTSDDEPFKKKTVTIKYLFTCCFVELGNEYDPKLVTPFF